MPVTAFRVGIAAVDFTPEPGLPLMGNFRDDYAARGVHDPLYAKAIVFEDRHGTKAGLLAVDVCMLDRRNVAMMRRAVGSQCDVPPENVLIHATHTHSAPAPNERFLFGIDFEPYRGKVDAFLAEAAGAVALADENLSEAAVSVGYAKEDRVSFNRRLRCTDGSTQMNWEALQAGFDPDRIDGPWGPIDPEVACLAIHRDGRPIAAVVNFALHPAILAGDNWLYSADFPGYLSESLAKTIGDDFTCLFLNGCCGNVNHVDYREPLQGRGWQMAQRVGYMLGAAAHQAIKAANPIGAPGVRQSRPDARGGTAGSSSSAESTVGQANRATRADRIEVTREKVTLRRIQISDDQHRWCERVLEEAARNPLPGQVDGLPDAFFAELRLEMHRQQGSPDEVEVMVLRIGDVALVGLPGENFCETGMEIKRRSPARHTLVAGLCNDAIGYLPTRESFRQGGYETTIGSAFYQADAAERLAASAVRQLEALFPAGSGQWAAS